MGKKNRAKRPEGGGEARGIFELVTIVGLCRFPSAACNEQRPKLIGHSKNNSAVLPEIGESKIHCNKIMVPNFCQTSS